MRLHSPAARVLGTLAAITLALTAGHAVAAGSLNPLVALALFFALVVALVLGSALCGVLGLCDNGRIDLLHALLLGMVLLGFLLMALALVTPLGVSGNFVLVAMLAAVLGRMEANREFPAGQGRSLPLVDPAGLLTIGVALAAAACWSAENLRGIRVVSPGFVEAYPWKDMFVHARNVSRFMNPGGAASLGNDMLLGLPLPPYHYAGYMIPALAGRISGAHSYALATSILPMLGMLWTALAAYVLGKTCAGSKVGAVAAMGILLVPDPAAIGLGNGWTGYFFFQQVGVGGLYAVAVMALATSHGLRAVQTGDRRPLLSAAALIAIAAFYKVQIVLVYGMPLALFVLWHFRQWDRRVAVAGSLSVLVLYALLVGVMGRIPNAPSLGFSTEGVLPAISQVIRFYPPPVALWLRGVLIQDISYLRLLVLASALLLVATYGIWLVVLGACARRARPADRGRAFILHLALLAPLLHLVVALALAPNRAGFGDIFEVTHKTFVWPYFMVAVGCSILVGGWLEGRFMALPGRWSLAVGTAAIASGIGVAAAVGPTTQASLPWSGQFIQTKIPRNHVDAASYLRAHSHPDAIVQSSENDAFLILAGLSERSSFVIACAINCGRPRPLVVQRLAQVGQVLANNDVADVRSGARALGIDWLVVRGGARPWQGARQAAPDAVFGDLFLYSTLPRG